MFTDKVVYMHIIQYSVAKLFKVLSDLILYSKYKIKCAIILPCLKECVLALQIIASCEKATNCMC